MKNLFFALMLVSSISLAADSGAPAGSAYDMNYETVLKIQMDADKAHNVFVSREATAKVLQLIGFEFALTPTHDIQHPSVFNIYLLSRTNSDSVIWANALAEYRFATSEDGRLKLINSLLAAAISKGEYISSSAILDCETSRVKLDMPADGSVQVNISFHPTVSKKDIVRDRPLNLRMNAYVARQGNIAIRELYDLASEVAKAQGKKHIRGILYAWVPDINGGPALLQSCDITESI
jgi:hypothetical protein